MPGWQCQWGSSGERHFLFRLSLTNFTDAVAAIMLTLLCPASRTLCLPGLLLLLLLSSVGRAQEPAPSPKFFSVGVGALHLQAVEGALYPKRQMGPGLHLHLLSHRQKRLRSREWQLLLQYGRPRTVSEQQASSHWLRLRLSHGQLWPVAEGKWGRLQAGPVAQLHYHLGYYEALDDSHLYWANHASLGAGLRWQGPRLAQEGRGFRARLDLPVGAVASRPWWLRQHKIDDLSGRGLLRMLHRNPWPVAWGQLLAPQGEVAYQLAPANRRAREFFYGLEYQRLALYYSWPYRHLLHQAGFRLSF
jgi:hypothetical protein